MQVIPVIDLMRGQVVRGVGGRRDQYRPVQSILAADARPQTVARALYDFGFRTAYVADLDAIISGAEKEKTAATGPAWSIYEDLLRDGWDLWIDAGIATVSQARAMAEFRAAGRAIAAIVLGLESLDGPQALQDIVAAIGPERSIFSLDLRAGVPLTDAPAWHGLRAEQIAAVAVRAGVRRMIVLDLARVGMGSGGGTEPLCRKLRCLDAGLQIVGGGGVRGPQDLRSFEASGCDAVLVASALHDGRLIARDCARWR